MIIANLNIRGLGGGTKASYIKHILAKEGVDFLCLQETKTSVVSEARCFSLWGDSNVGWIHNEGVNGAQSLLSLWHKDAFCYDNHVMGRGFIVIVGEHVKTKCKCVVVNVYAACNLYDKFDLWKELTGVKGAHQNLAWCLCGDFNAVRSEEERKGVRGNASQKKEIFGFNNFIQDNLLVELPLVGKKFTWYKENGSAKSRIDRVLVSEEWIQRWPMCKQYVQPRVVSDHCALIVKSCVKDWGPKPFRSIDAWQMEHGFKELVKEKWNSYCVQGNGISSLKDKLKLLKTDLKDWNTNVFGNMDLNKRMILKEIEELDVKDNDIDLEENDKLRRLELISQLRVLDKKLESLHRQKARANWIKFGDSNSKFFHSVIRWRRLCNEVKGVDIDNQWCEDPVTVRREARNLFEERFTATHDFGVSLGSVEFKTITKETNLSLILVFTEVEVKDAVWQCEGSKSPGPDGFNFNFIKYNWDTLKHDVMEAVKAFQETGCIPKGCNASFIALIPKVSDPTSLD